MHQSSMRMVESDDPTSARPTVFNERDVISSLTESDLRQTREAFDAASAAYDTAYESLPGIQWFRLQTRRLYLAHFPSSGTLLDLNCGTGNDAIFLAKQGYTILATDISAGMLEQTRRKANDQQLNDQVVTAQIPFGELSSLKGRSFDGAYSNMGGLNCTDRLESIAIALAQLIRPGGMFIATVMPSFCLWETLSSLCRLRFQRAFRRQAAHGVIANVHGGSVRTFYHSPRRFQSAFSPYFDHVSTLGLGVLLPPPNHERAYAMLGSGLEVLKKMESFISKSPPFPSMADHFVMTLRRTSA